MHERYHLIPSNKRVVLLHCIGWILVIASCGASLVLLSKAGWNEFPPRAWREFALLWAMGSFTPPLLSYGIESVLPLLPIVCTLAFLPMAKQLFERLEQEQRPKPTQRVVPLDRNAPLLLPSITSVHHELAGCEAASIITPFPVAERREKDTEPTLAVAALHTSSQKSVALVEPPLLTHEVKELKTEVHVCISLLGEMQVWLDIQGEQLPISIKSHRRQELLAYIATHAPERSKAISSGRILTDVFEHILPGGDVENLRGLFQKHTQLLRREINEVVQAAGYPKLKLFQFEKGGNSSTKWWLSDECRVVDLSQLRQLAERVEATKEHHAENIESLQDTCNQLITLYQSYEGDYLEKHLRHDEFGDCEWVRAPFTDYRDIYLQALWDVAVIEHTCCMQPGTPEEQRHRSARHAALLYREYALHAVSCREFDLNVRKSKRQSERALRGCLRMYRWLSDAQGADEAYSAYERLMAENFPEWKPNVTTIDILRGVRQLSGSIALVGAFEPPEL